MRNLRQIVTGYSVALLSAAFGIALPMVTKPFVGQSAPWVSFIPAVLLSAWYGGFISGLATSGLLVAATLTLEDVLFTTRTTSANRIFGASMFSLAALAICLVVRALRCAQADALAAADAARAAEFQAQSGRDRLEAILRDLPVGVLITTEDRTTGLHHVELANPAAAEIFGVPIHPGDDLLSHRPASFRSSAGDEKDVSRWPILRTLASGEAIVNEELDIVRPDGSPRAVMINSRPLQGSAGQPAAIAAYSDVTSLRAAQAALRASEVRLRRLFDSPIIGVVSGEGDIARDANDGFLRMLGYSRQELRDGEIRLSALTPAEYLADDARTARQLAERGFSDPVSKELLASGGHRVPVMVGTTSFEPGQASPWIAWVLDLSEHRKLEERLRQAAKAESIGLLAGGVAHDFNNLLTIIMGNTSLAQAALPEGSQGRIQLEGALRAGERAADLTRQLLAYAGKGQFVVQSTDVSAAIRAVASLFRASAPKAVDVQLDLASGLPPVNADATQIQQLAMNLVINGVESLAERPGFVRIATSAVEVDERFPVAELAPGTYILVKVSDTGCGMDQETRERIFDPFFTTKFTGRGLGLAAAAGIVRVHRGAMVVHSTPGLGSTFQVFLPVVSSGVAQAGSAMPGAMPENVPSAAFAD